MNATINGLTYDTEEAEEICMCPSPDGDDILYRTEDGRFFLQKSETFMDGVKLCPDQDPDDIIGANYEGMDDDDFLDELEKASRERERRCKTTRTIVPMTEREALLWCVKTQIPDCFRGYVLESI